MTDFWVVKKQLNEIKTYVSNGESSAVKKPIPLSFLQKGPPCPQSFFCPVADWHFLASSNWPKTVK